VAKARRNWQNRLEHYFAAADELQCIKKERIAFLVTASNIVAVKPARNRRTAGRRNQADHLEEKGWLQGRYRYKNLSRLFSHLISLTGGCYYFNLILKAGNNIL